MSDHASVPARTLTYRVVRRVMVLVHAPGTPDEAEWKAFITRSRQEAFGAVLVYAPHTPLNASQRAEVGEIAQRRRLLVAILTASPVTRCVVTALGWLSGLHRAFEPNAIKPALDYLHIPSAFHHEIESELGRLREALIAEATEAALAH